MSTKLKSQCTPEEWEKQKASVRSSLHRRRLKAKRLKRCLTCNIKLEAASIGNCNTCRADRNEKAKLYPSVQKAKELYKERRKAGLCTWCGMQANGKSLCTNHWPRKMDKVSKPKRAYVMVKITRQISFEVWTTAYYFDMRKRLGWTQEEAVNQSRALSLKLNVMGISDRSIRENELHNPFRSESAQAYLVSETLRMINRVRQQRKAA